MTATAQLARQLNRADVVVAEATLPALDFTQELASAEALISWVSCWRHNGMCRNIRTLFNFAPPATEQEIRAAALQFVRKVGGFNTPSKANEAAFYAAVDDIASITSQLLDALESGAAPKNRQEEAAKAQARAAQRYGK